METNGCEGWAIVEVMGHRRYVGRVSEQTVAGTGFVRVDVPASPAGPAFTKLLGPGSIYAISPCTQETALACAGHFGCRPFDAFELPRLPAGGAGEPGGGGAGGGEKDSEDDDDEDELDQCRPAGATLEIHDGMGDES